MSIPFSRSTRSLSMDSYRPAIIALVLAMIILSALLIWLFSAKVTLYQTSQSATLNPDGTIEAVFSAEAFALLKPGQKASLRLGQGTDQRPISIPAVVFDTQGGKEKVLLLITDYTDLPGIIPEALQGRVDVEAEYISPLELLLRASGRYFSREADTSSPQATEVPNQP